MWKYFLGSFAPDGFSVSVFKTQALIEVGKRFQARSLVNGRFELVYVRILLSDETSKCIAVMEAMSQATETSFYRDAINDLVVTTAEFVAAEVAVESVEMVEEALRDHEQ